MAVTNEAKQIDHLTVLFRGLDQSKAVRRRVALDLRKSSGLAITAHKMSIREGGVSDSNSFGDLVGYKPLKFGLTNRGSITIFEEKFAVELATLVRVHMWNQVVGEGCNTLALITPDGQVWPVNFFCRDNGGNDWTYSKDLIDELHISLSVRNQLIDCTK